MQGGVARTMKYKIGDLVVFRVDNYNIVGINPDTRQYYLEPENGDDEVAKLSDRIWVDAKEIE
jgi:hypothetical protein